MTDRTYRPAEQPDGPSLPDGGMRTGSEGGDPGDRLGDLPLTDAEQAVLATLRSGTHADVSAPEATLRAAADDTVAPAGSAGEEDDPLTPVFQPPTT